MPGRQQETDLTAKQARAVAAFVKAHEAIEAETVALKERRLELLVKARQAGVNGYVLSAAVGKGVAWAYALEREARQAGQI